MSDICTDNRFEVIDQYKQKLIESTNIEQSPKEMEVIDNILFRFWQMGWLKELIQCKDCKHHHEAHYEEDGEKPIIKHKCKLLKGYQFSENHYCGFAERKEE